MPFCRFGFEEQLTLEDVRTLINRRELKADDLLLIDDTTQWKRAREIAVLQPYFLEDEPPPRKKPDVAAVRRRFEAQLTSGPVESNGSDLFKGIIGLIVIVVGAGMFISAALDLLANFNRSNLVLILIGTGMVAWGITAIVRPDKVSLDD